MTRDEIEAAMSVKGGWTKKQLEEWGVPWPPPKGWKKRLIEEAEPEKPIPDAVPVGKLIAPVIDRLGVAFELNQYTESPIETILGAELILGSEKFPGLTFIPQYPWRRYRIDWAALVVATDAPALFIECDGRDFHTSESQVAKDRARDKECADAGIKVLRFTGADINRNAALCALEVFRQLRESGCR